MDQNEAIYELMDRTARMDSKLDFLVDSISKQENRIQNVEGHINRGYGIVAVITLAITTVGQTIWHKLFGQSS
jgi:hypothetical protein